MAGAAPPRVGEPCPQYGEGEAPILNKRTGAAERIIGLGARIRPGVASFLTCLPLQTLCDFPQLARVQGILKRRVAHTNPTRSMDQNSHGTPDCRSWSARLDPKCHMATKLAEPKIRELSRDLRKDIGFQVPFSAPSDSDARRV